MIFQLLAIVIFALAAIKVILEYVSVNNLMNYINVVSYRTRLAAQGEGPLRKYR